MPKRNVVVSESEDSDHSPKKRKNPPNVQRYKDLYRELWPCLQPSKKGASFVHCSVCNVDFSCNHGGRNDCKRHIESKQHADYVALKAKQKCITSFMKTPSSSGLDLQITNAEVLMTEFVSQQNLPLSTVDTMDKLVKKMFPDSKIAQGKGMSFVYLS